MKFLFLASIFMFVLNAKGGDLSSAMTSVKLAPGLEFSEPKAKGFSSIEEAQKFANVSGLNEITLRVQFQTKESDCGLDIPALSFGFIYDQDKALLNGQLIGSTGNPKLSNRRLSLLPRVYPIPNQILRCPGENQLDLSLKRILGGWIGPFAGAIELGELHELQQKAMLAEAKGPLFQKDIGILLLAISVLLISLFFRYPDNHRQSAFVVFSFAASLLCLSLSGWYYRYFDSPQVIFRLHTVLVSLALLTQVLFVAAYRELKWAKRISRPLVFFGGLVAFSAISFSISSSATLLSVYIFELLALITASLVIYFLPLLRPSKFRAGREFNVGIELSLFLIHLGSTMDIARIWKLHNFENMSPYTYGVGLFAIGSILAAELVRVFQKAALTAETESRLKQSQRQTEFARQVAHDMRSPLSALNMMASLLGEVPEDGRLIIRNATARINDIANSLLNRKWSATVTTDNGGAEVPSAQALMLSSLVDSIVSEKRVQYREIVDLDIEIDLSASYGLFSTISGADLARALSNLIDNAVEACTGRKGKILVSIEPDALFNRIVVADNGKGIDPEIAGRLGRPGASFGKDIGSGLGLFQAINAAEGAGGKLMISSQVNDGTSVVISLPRAKPPEWFVSHLTVDSSQQFVSVDDDQTVHQIWDNRLKSLCPARPKHFAFTSIGQFEEWYQGNAQLPAVFLIDFEFLGQAENGLQVIERLNLSDRVILVSSRAEDKFIQERALSLGVKLLPKSLAPLIPIEISQSSAQPASMAL